MHETAHALTWVRHLNYMVGLSYIISNDGIVQLNCRIPYLPQISHFSRMRCKYTIRYVRL